MFAIDVQPELQSWTYVAPASASHFWQPCMQSWTKLGVLLELPHPPASPIVKPMTNRLPAKKGMVLLEMLIDRSCLVVKGQDGITKAAGRPSSSEVGYFTDATISATLPRH
ncbi:MAG TPA: hypothetical protein VLT58_15625 [Polyangia bacterium]|nr:hypothetical protein [Polyangia bacterium]